MTRGLATRFKNVTALRQDSPLDNDQLLRIAPSIFANDKHESRSDRYTYIPTIEVLEQLRNEGFQPFAVAQSKTRIEGKQDFTKHMLRLRHANQITSSEANEIVLINSHDGTSSYQILGGVYRFVCHNGMVSGDTLMDRRIRHSGNIVDGVIEAAYEIVDSFEIIDRSIDSMKSTSLTSSEAKLLAEAALTYKYDSLEEAPIKPERLLEARRYEDRTGDNATSVWGNFNRIQENLIKGGQSGWSQIGKRTTTREVKSIDNDVKLNKALWVLSEQMAKLKAN